VTSMAGGEATAAKLADVADIVIMIMGAQATVAIVGATLVRSRWRADRADEGGRPSVAGECPERGGGGEEGKTRGMAPEGWGR
jgi:hypothetical protein